MRLLIIGLILITLPNSFISFRKMDDYVVRLLLSTFNLLITLTVIAVLIPQKYSTYGVDVASGFLALVIVSGLVNLTSHLYRQKDLRDWIPVAIILGAFSVVSILSPSGIRYHSSPDNHGFAATVGYFAENFSLRALSIDFQNVTGLTDNSFYGQATPNFDSVWHIPDVQLRFAADNVFQVGRISTPLLGAALSNLFGASSVFPWYLLFFTFLGSWITGYLMLRVSLIMARILVENRSEELTKHKESLTSRTPQDHSSLIKLFSTASSSYLIATMISFSTWAQVFTFEGTLNQVWFHCAVLATLYLSLIRILGLSSWAPSNIGKVKRQNIVMFIPPLALATFYPNGILLLLFQSAFLIFFGAITFRTNQVIKSAKNERKKLKRLIIFSITGYTLVSLISSVALIKDSFIVITKNFLRGAPNQPYSLGAIPFDKLFSFTNFDLSFDRVQGFGTGFSPIHTSVERAMSPLLIIIASVAILGLIVAVRSGIAQSLPALSCLAFALPHILLPLPALLNASEVFWPYQYFRNLVSIFTFSLPVILAVLLSLHRKSLIRRKKNLPANFRLALVLLLLISTAGFLQRGKNFESNSEPFLSIQNIEIVDFKERPFFIADESFHQTYQLSLFGPLYNLTDNWEPEFSEMTERPIFAVTKTGEKVFQLRLIGTFRLDKPLRGPIFIRDLVDAPN